jgi:hypothetical protein
MKVEKNNLPKPMSVDVEIKAGPELHQKMLLARPARSLGRTTAPK